MKNQTHDPSADAESDEFLERYLPGSSPAVVHLRRCVAKLNSPHKMGLIRTVLVRGATGVGKSYFARVMAANRRWREIRNTAGDAGLDTRLDAYLDRFDEIHMPALPDELIEAELFGYKKGAFTGAGSDKPGLLAGDADDILLDEIGDISPAMQMKLLALIEHGRFRPLGGKPDEVHQTSARLIMATNRPLEKLVRKRRFREDLYHRVRLFVVTVPPLREQPENIEQLSRQIEDELQQNVPSNPEKSHEPRLSNEDISWARTYAWPGNVRELRYAIARWLFEDGEQTLQQIVNSMRDEEDRSSHINGIISDLVRARLNAILYNDAPPPGTLGGLVKPFVDEVREAISDWYRTVRPSDDQLHKLFPDHRSLDSIRNKLSQWRRRS